MKRYEDYKKDKNRIILTDEELKKIVYTKFKIVVPTKEDRQELINAFKHIHYADIDTEFITVNQLAHEYLEGSNIIVDPVMYNIL